MWVDGALKTKSHRLTGGEIVTYEPPAPAVTPATDPAPPEIVVAFEDDHLLVVDKPAGVVVHPGAGETSGTLAAAVALRGAAGGPDERPGIVHRLDRDTSGLLVVAKSEAAYERLTGLVRRRQLEREYLALVHGRPRSWHGRIDAAIGRDRRHPTRRSLDGENARPAVSHFQVERLLEPYALLRVRLETGRTHQIRVHLAAIELPVVGDRTYGTPGLGLSRQFLHACRLAFTHPVSGDRVDVSSQLPEELEAALALASGT